MWSLKKWKAWSSTDWPTWSVVISHAILGLGAEIMTVPIEQNQPLLSTSLQTAHNLRLLPQLVSNLLADLNDAVETRIGKALDLDSIGKEVAQKGECGE
jgi:hypothetical protein